MSDQTDNQERDAQKEIGKNLDEIYDKAEDLDKGDLSDEAKSKSNSTGKADKEDKATAENASEEIQDELDELKEEFSRAEYKKANKRRRKLAKKIKATLKTGANDPGGKMLAALKKIRKSKLIDLWRPAPVVAKQSSSAKDNFIGDIVKECVSAPDLAPEIALRASLDVEFENVSKHAIQYLPLSAVSGITDSDAEVLKETMGIDKVGDLTAHTVLQRLLYLNTVC
ncbi:MAG: hypothetical protein OQJ89_04825 [Kangiellaceae bacterium]|nr:hypothetical protein [Kangiellaceae bacterium]MCW8997622.1 hypothetical protein [Kangiellaceae bacterium]MCW9016267.1 hypothetical protein [Kangiellaceae bacterium]